MIQTNGEQFRAHEKYRLPKSCLFRSVARGRLTKLAAKRVSKMTVTGKTEFQRDLGDITGAVGESLERSTKSKLGEVTMHRHAGLLLKDSRKMKR